MSTEPLHVRTARALHPDATFECRRTHQPTCPYRSKSAAKGNAFAGATGLPHGVYTRPTFFPLPGSGALQRFAKGGVLGEAGPEAIMPLSRNAQGKLGVTGTGVQVNVYNNADVQVSTKESQGPDGQQVIDMFIDRRINEKFGNGSMDKIMRNNYGLNRYAGA